MTSKKDQLKNIINLVKIAESNEDAMDIDQDTEFDKHLTLYHKILNSEINYNKIPKSYDWVQNCLFNYRDKEFRKTLRMDKSTFWISINYCYTIFKDEYIVWPQENYRKEVHKGFENFGFPMVIGAIDGSHIPLMEAPKKNNDEWEENDNNNNDGIDDAELIYEFDEDEDLISKNNAKIKQQNLLEVICINM
ncbi:hypothetical protein C2G38_2137784 [Gigaspora rosea]|uniref:DDE Tnp4 domain-containing protein n=1 Tax=Gigaspora rosea TaxID=44941 RepID=A0A397VYA0_9GLOM|nr:hypothetical protein C2G38_2137784 [Gigaspora rosea]